ncbi:MAG: YhbY family RNA-binding protein [Opitutaceae bacterium]|jgi:RNA-binding protein
MQESPLTGSQKTFLRGQGQLLAPTLKVGKVGLTQAFFAEFDKALRLRELVKLRFLGADRDERALWCARIAGEGRCTCVGAVGHTALFYRRNPEPAGRRIELP